MSTNRTARCAAVALAVATIGAPTAVASPAAVRAPIAAVDLRSPDTRDVAAAAEAGRDLRSPDTRDAAAAAIASRPVRHDVATVVVKPESDGSSWDDLGIIGGGAVVALFAAFATRRRRTVRRPATV